MKSINEIPANVKNWEITILGAGRSGISAAILLLDKGAKVILSDSHKKEIPVFDQFQNKNIRFDLGQHSEFIYDADLVVVSPGIPNSSPAIQKFEHLKIPIISEIEMAYWFTRDVDIIGITGSNGKTTTTTLIYQLFKNAGFDAYCGGNIGTAFSEAVLEMEKSDSTKKIIVLELSSFQLERIVHFKPKISFFLNLSDDHMDRYDNNLEKYMEAKLRITMNQDNTDFYIYNLNDKILCENLPKNCTIMTFGLRKKNNIYFHNDQIFYKDQKLFHIDEILLKGRHNVYNILAALNAALIYDLPIDSVCNTIKNFQPIEHRLEYVAMIDSVEYYNDSKATNVESVKYALESFTKPIIVILGGKDKNSDFSLLIPYLKKYCRHTLLIGDATEKLQATLTDTIPITIVKSMEEAVEKASFLANPYDIVLLSPACASFDMFDNFEHRGKVFKECVKKLGTNEKY